MSQCVNSNATKPADLSYNSSTHIVIEDKSTPLSCTQICTPGWRMCMPTRVDTYSHRNHKCKILTLKKNKLLGNGIQ